MNCCWPNDTRSLRPNVPRNEISTGLNDGLIIDTTTLLVLLIVVNDVRLSVMFEGITGRFMKAAVSPLDLSNSNVHM